MKKLLTLFLLLTTLVYSTVAQSYDNNEYQRESRRYSELAKQAFDEGDYTLSIEYSKKAEDYASKSYAYIQKMLARLEAENQMNRARTRYTWAKKNNAEKTSPEAFAQATEALNAGGLAFQNEKYDVAVLCANQVLDALSVVRGDESEFLTLPSQYTIRTFRGEKDCLWNIAANPAVYNDPFMWKVLYEANKDKLPDAADPNWVEPGIVLDIPSIKGETRSGMYDPAAVYKSFSNIKR
ncbi:MAG: hypothetical protein P1P64_09595 [Treponemataceae bacterium]